MIILSSPSGAGKTTLVNLLSRKDNYVISVSHTTRDPRPGENNHKDYHFVNDKTADKQAFRMCDEKENLIAVGIFNKAEKFIQPRIVVV